MASGDIPWDGGDSLRIELDFGLGSAPCKIVPSLPVLMPFRPGLPPANSLPLSSPPPVHPAMDWAGQEHAGNFAIELAMPLAPPVRQKGVEAQIEDAISPAALAARQEARELVLSGFLKEAYKKAKGTFGGAYLSGDDLAALIPAVRRNPWEGYGAIGDITNPLMLEMIEERLSLPGRTDERVVFTMGMPASGKSTVARCLLEDHVAHTVVDSPMGHIETARAMRTLAVDGGRTAEFLMVMRPLVQAVRGMLDRARIEGEGRPVPLLDMADLFVGSARTFRQMADMNIADERTHLSMALFDTEGEIPYKPRMTGLDEALTILDEMEEVAASGPGGVLGAIARAYIDCIRDAEWEGVPFAVELLRRVEDGLPDGFLDRIANIP